MDTLQSTSPEVNRLIFLDCVSKTMLVRDQLNRGVDFGISRIVFILLLKRKQNEFCYFFNPII